MRTTQPAPGTHRVRAAVGVLGELLVTLGLVLVLFVVYEVYWTDLISAGKQQDATNALDRQWADNPVVGNAQRSNHPELADGKGFAKLYVPSFGSDYHFTVLEGTNAATLEVGPDHYAGTALPGEPGNFAVAGHRVGKGAPFNDLDQLRACDAVVVETASSWFVYRVLPMAGDSAADIPACTASPTPVTVPDGAYNGLLGREVVAPSDGGVIAPVPDHPGAAIDPGQQRAVLTLTTCTPKFSASQRLIIHATLVRTMARSGTATPPEMAVS